MKRVSVIVALIAIIAAPAFAQEKKVGGYVDINVGIASPAESAFSHRAEQLLWSEPETWKFDYNVPSMRSVDFGAGVFFTPLFGAGVAVTTGSSEGNPHLAYTRPHPNYYNRPATGELDGRTALTHSETALHLQFQVRPRTPDAIQLRFFAGPSRVSLKQGIVTNFKYNQVWLFTANAVEIDSYTTGTASVSAWGFNAGADVGYFFSRNIGVGAVVRYSRATVALMNSAEDIVDVPATEDLAVGGMHIGFGLRARF